MGTKASIEDKLNIGLQREAQKRNLEWPPEFMGVPAVKLSEMAGGRDRRDITKALSKMGIDAIFNNGKYGLTWPKS
jgi:hypothetical protein